MPGSERKKKNEKQAMLPMQRKGFVPGRWRSAGHAQAKDIKMQQLRIGILGKL